MAKLNIKSTPSFTHEGGKASRINPKDQLRRSVLSCLLWENTFYEDGVSIAERILSTAESCNSEFISQLAIQARNDYRLRHAPLWLCVALAKKGGSIVSKTLSEVIQRPDELGEFIAMYNHNGKQPLSSQIKIGLGNAFNKFNEYQFAKWNRKAQVNLKCVLMLTHPKPKDEAQSILFKKILEDKLEVPGTWENRLSSGENKGEVFTDLLKTNKLGYMALLMNLRNMIESGVDEDLIKEKLISGAEKSKALPFRYVAAARACPRLEETIDEAMELAMKTQEKNPGKTVILIDVSASMHNQLSTRSTLNRLDAASALSVYARKAFSDCRVFTFSYDLVEVPPRYGMSLIDAINVSQDHGGTYMAGAINKLNETVEYDRIIIVTDEQSHDGAAYPLPNSKAYLLNVATYKNGIGYGQYTHINGWSDASIRYIQEIEKRVD